MNFGKKLKTMNEKLIKELNKLRSRNDLEDWEEERLQELEDEFLEKEDMSYQCLMEISE